MQHSRQVLSGSCFVSVVICELPSDEKFPPRSLMSVPEKCAWPVSAGVGWPLSDLDWAGGLSPSAASLSSCPPVPHWPPCGGAQLAMPWLHDPSSRSLLGWIFLCSVCCFNCWGQQQLFLPWFWHWYLIFIQLAQPQNLGETLNSFLEVF